MSKNFSHWPVSDINHKEEESFQLCHRLSKINVLLVFMVNGHAFEPKILLCLMMEIAGRSKDSQDLNLNFQPFFELN